MQVTNFFAISSRFGTPEDFKCLVDTAHGWFLSPVHLSMCSNQSLNVKGILGLFYADTIVDLDSIPILWSLNVLDHGALAGLGLMVTMDIVHSHAAPNEGNGLASFDGANDCYFYPGTIS